MHWAKLYHGSCSWSNLWAYLRQSCTVLAHVIWKKHEGSAFYQIQYKWGGGNSKLSVLSTKQYTVLFATEAPILSSFRRKPANLNSNVVRHILLLCNGANLHTDDLSQIRNENMVAQINGWLNFMWHMHKLFSCCPSETIQILAILNTKRKIVFFSLSFKLCRLKPSVWFNIEEILPPLLFQEP